jgi:hypothetical protein
MALTVAMANAGMAPVITIITNTEGIPALRTADNNIIPISTTAAANM